MGDQYLYFSILQNTRSFDFLSHEDPKPLITSWLLSLMPLPFVETIQSLGFFNRYLFIIFFILIYNKNFLKGLPLYFILFYPSLIFYTSLSLRDPVVLFFMILGTVFLIEKKYLISLISIIPLYFIKFKNFYFILFIYSLSIVLDIKKYQILFLSLIIPLTTLTIFNFFGDILASIDYYREALYKENGGNVANYEGLEGFSDLIIQGIIAFPYFLFKPFPWEASNFFQTVQSYENIIVVLFLIFFTKKSYSQSRLLTIKWLLFFVFSITIYGITVYNFGTVSRYRFPIIAVYVIGLSYDLFKNKGYKFKELFNR